MSCEKGILISLLKLTSANGVQQEQIKKDARVPLQVMGKFFNRLSEAGLIHLNRNRIEASTRQRLSLAVKALELGADYEKICKLLSWTEFEAMAAQIFEANGFSIVKNLHFQHARKRWEIDVLGCREPLIICVDCKHWQRGWRRSAIMKAAESQVERTKAFANALPNCFQKARLAKWKVATLVPVILSLIPGPFRFHNNVPIVSVLQLQDFINELPMEAHSLAHFSQIQVTVDKKLTDYAKQ